MPSSEHIMKCPTCGEKFDRRNLGEVFDHSFGHDPNIMHDLAPHQETLKKIKGKRIDKREN